MKFNVPSKDLLSQLQAVSKVINAKNAMSILDNFLFEVKDSRLYITGSDQENIMTASLEVFDVEGEGSVAINSRRVLDILKEIPQQGVTFDIDDDTHQVTFILSTGRFQIMGIDAAEFPKGESLGEDCRVLNIPTAIVQKGIENTIFAVSTETLRPVMMGIYWDIHENDITFVSSDTHKLVRYISREMTPGLEASFIMPAKPAAILRGVISDGDEEVSLTIGEKNASFEVGDYKLTCRFIKGNYPNYNRVIPSDNPYKMTFDRSLMLPAMRRMSLFASMASGLVRFDIKSDHVHVNASDPDYGVSGEEDVTCQYEGNEMTIGFKAAFIIEVLNNMKSDTICLKLSDPSRPGIFVPEEEKENEEILILLMPMQTFDY